MLDLLHPHLCANCLARLHLCSGMPTLDLLHPHLCASCLARLHLCSGMPTLDLLHPHLCANCLARLHGDKATTLRLLRRQAHAHKFTRVTGLHAQLRTSASDSSTQEIKRVLVSKHFKSNKGRQQHQGSSSGQNGLESWLGRSPLAAEHTQSYACSSFIR